MTYSAVSFQSFVLSHLVKTLSAIPKLLTVNNNNTVSTNLEEVNGSSS